MILYKLTGGKGDIGVVFTIKSCRGNDGGGGEVNFGGISAATLTLKLLGIGCIFSSIGSWSWSSIFFISSKLASCCSSTFSESSLMAFINFLNYPDYS